jgi:hypothetical protein
VTCDCYSLATHTGGTTTVLLPTPERVAKHRTNPDTGIAVDACIADVVAHLWANDVWTLSSCCGHGRKPPGLVLNDDRYDVDRLHALVAEVDGRRFEFWQWQLVQLGVEAEARARVAALEAAIERGKALRDRYGEPIDVFQGEVLAVYEGRVRCS